MNLVYDACALIAYLENEPVAEQVEALLSDASYTGFVHTINLCEVFYHVRRIHGDEAALGAYDVILGLGMNVWHDLDEPLWQHAARLKADYRRISLADCICAALAERVGGQVVTRDREFEPLVTAGACRALYVG